MTDPATATAFDAAFDEFRELLRADGADVTVESREEGKIVLQLVLKTAGCADCVMPRPHLERVARDLLEHAGASVQSPTVVDPREAGD